MILIHVSHTYTHFEWNMFNYNWNRSRRSDSFQHPEYIVRLNYTFFFYEKHIWYMEADLCISVNAAR